MSEDLIFKKIFEGMKQAIYISDPETYKILYVNKIMRKLFPGDIIGKKCYKIFQALDQPCPFCTNDKLFGENPISPYIWDCYNKKIEKWFHNTDQAIEWEGKKVRFEMAEDITEKKKLEQKVKSNIKKLEILNEIIILGNRAKNLSELLEIILNSILELTEFSGGAIYLVDVETRTAEIKYHQGLPTDFVDKFKHIKIDDIPPHKTVLVDGQPFIIDNYEKVEPELASKYELKGLASIPLLNKGKVMGALNITLKDRYQFTEGEKRILQAIGREAGTVIAKIQLEKGLESLIDKKTKELEERERELSIITRISTVFLTIADKEMYGKVLDIILEVMESQYGTFGYIEENGDLVIPTMTREVWDQCQVPDKTFTFPKETWGDSIWPRSISQKKILYSNKPSNRTPKGHISITRNISAPIIHRDKVIGLIQVANKDTDYNENDLKIMENITNQIAPILKARLQRDLQGQKRKKAEKEIQETLEELKKKNRELERFAYVASHDLQEPLRMISSFTQLLEKRYKNRLDKDADDFITFIVDGAKRMQNLINDLLIYSRVGRGDKPLKPINTSIVLKDVLNNLRDTIEDTKAKITHEKLPMVIANETEIVQLFQNLISNALKFHGEEPPRIHVSVKEKKDEWIFSVQDNGIGIDSQYFDRIFIIFQRLHKKNEYGGTGIGLALCKKIVERLGGKIWVKSQVGKGSIFYFSIPKKKEILKK